MRKLLFVFLLAGLIILAGCGQKNTSANTSATSVKEPIFFYSNDCGHCQKVKQYIADYKIEEKVSFSLVEAFTSEANYDLFNEKAAACRLSGSRKGVPLIYENGKCYVGEIEAIDFFKKKAGL